MQIIRIAHNKRQNQINESKMPYKLLLVSSLFEELLD